MRRGGILKYRKLPARNRLCELLEYSPETGVFLWRERGAVRGWKRSLVGTVAGTPCAKGIVIFVDGRPFYAHRLAWVYEHGDGSIPELAQIDHKNCNCLDNRLSNLRVATHAQNASNARKKSGLPYPKGVRPQSRGGGFMARIQHNKRTVHLGTFRTAKAAHAAYQEAAARLKGEFARAS